MFKIALETSINTLYTLIKYKIRLFKFLSSKSFRFSVLGIVPEVLFCAEAIPFFVIKEVKV